MWFKLRHDVPESFLETAPWIFRSEVTVDMTVDECWKVLLDDNAWGTWHPEVLNVQWKKKDGGGGDAGSVAMKGEAGAERTVVFSDALFNVLLMGSVGIDEKFDVWDDKNDNVRRLSFYFQGMTRPNFLTYTAGREEFRVERTGDDGSTSTCKFTRIVALEPGFATRYLLGPVAYSRCKHMFEVKCPQRFLAAFGQKKQEQE